MSAKNLKHEPIAKLSKNFNSSSASSTENSIERDLLCILQFDYLIERFIVDPVTIEYSYNMEKLQFTPNLLILYTNSKTYPKTKPLLCDLKYSQEIRKNWGKLKPMYSAAIGYCKSKNWRFQILNENRIRTPYLENVKFLWRYKDEVVDENNVNLLVKYLYHLKFSTPNELILAGSNDRMKQGELLFTLWHLIANNRINCDLNMKLRMDSEIWYNGL